MSVTSITIGITRNMGNYESLKVEITSSIGEGSDYEAAKDDIINKIMDAEASSAVLFSGNGGTKPSFVPKATPVTPATTTPTAEATKGVPKPSFVPKATPVTPATTTPTAEATKGVPKPSFVPKATPVTPATTTPTAEATKGATKPSFAPKATPVTPATTTPTAEVPKGVPKNPFAKKEATKEIPPLPTQITGLDEELPF